MKHSHLRDIEWRLSSLETYAKDLGALLSNDSPEHSDKMLKIAAYAAKLGTFIRLNEELPPNSLPKTIAVLQPIRRLRG